MSRRIAELNLGETFSECRFQVRSARVQDTATGPCLVLKLSDETGFRWARRWKATDAEQKHALAAQTLFVSGRVRTDGRFVGELEITELECLSRLENAAPAVPEAIFQNLAHGTEVNRQFQRFVASNRSEGGPKDEPDWQDDADSGWESYVGASRDDPEWEMMEEIVLDGMFERSERD